MIDVRFVICLLKMSCRLWTTDHRLWIVGMNTVVECEIENQKISCDYIKFLLKSKYGMRPILRLSASHLGLFYVDHSSSTQFHVYTSPKWKCYLAFIIYRCTYLVLGDKQSEFWNSSLAPMKLFAVGLTESTNRQLYVINEKYLYISWTLTNEIVCHWTHCFSNSPDLRNKYVEKKNIIIK